MTETPSFPGNRLSGDYIRHEARAERREGRIARRSRLGPSYYGPLEDVRVEGTCVGDCPACGQTVAVGWDQAFRGIVPVRCRSEGCYYAESHDYRELLE